MYNMYILIHNALLQIICNNNNNKHINLKENVNAMAAIRQNRRFRPSRAETYTNASDHLHSTDRSINFNRIDHHAPLVDMFISFNDRARVYLTRFIAGLHYATPLVVVVFVVDVLRLAFFLPSSWSLQVIKIN